MTSLMYLLPSFFLLMYQTLVLAICKLVTSANFHSDDLAMYTVHYKYASYADLRIPCGSDDSYIFAIPAALISCIFNFLPILLLIVYPMHRFRRWLAKCKLDGFALKFFVDRFQGCYKDGTDGGRDVRCFSGLYFFLRVVILLGIFIVKQFTMWELIWFPTGTLILVATLLVASCKPYKKTYMNVVDTLLLSYFGLLCYLMSVTYSFKKQYNIILPAVKILFLIPLAIFILYLVLQIVLKVIKSPLSYRKHSNAVENSRYTMNTHPKERVNLINL